MAPRLHIEPPGLFSIPLGWHYWQCGKLLRRQPPSLLQALLEAREPSREADPADALGGEGHAGARCATVLVENPGDFAGSVVCEEGVDLSDGVEGRVPDRKLPHGGRKAHELDVKAQI